ncbi:uncharacterized protein [Ptychodera flava]|uniref:uncharacterized protein n=1 Tax=Ptychodera flava TaxID=63121 RepID=UPI00396A98F3
MDVSVVVITSVAIGLGAGAVAYMAIKRQNDDIKNRVDDVINNFDAIEDLQNKVAAIDAINNKVDDIKSEVDAIEDLQNKVAAIGDLKNKVAAIDDMNNKVDDIKNKVDVIENLMPKVDEPDLLEYMRAPNPFFIGHEGKLEKIFKSYRKNQPKDTYSHPTQRRSVVHVINGPAGCGKSEIAVQYVDLYCEFYRNVLWIPAGSPKTLDYVFKQMSEKLNLFGEKKDLRADVIKKAVNDWLTEKSNWLLILDNADDSKCIFDYFPTFPAGGHIIITSRDKSYSSSALYPEVKRLFYIEPLELEDAMLLLLANCRKKESCMEENLLDDCRSQMSAMSTEDHKNHEALKWLAGPDGLDGLPLALIAAAKYMNENATTFSAYKKFAQTCVDKELFPTSEDDPLRAWLRDIDLEKYHSKLSEITKNSLTAFLELTEEKLHSIEMTDEEIRKFLEEREHGVNINKWMYRRKQVLATWSLSFRKLEKTKEGEAALELLQLCVFLEPTISEDLIVKGAESIGLECLKSNLMEGVEGYKPIDQPVQIRRNLNKVLRGLRRYCLVDSNYNGKDQKKSYQGQNSNFTIHRVIRKAIKAGLSKEKEQRAMSSAISLLTTIFPSYEEIYSKFTGVYHPLPEVEEEVTVHTKSLCRNLRKELLESKQIEDPIPLLYAVALFYKRFKRLPDEALPLYVKAVEAATTMTTGDDIFRNRTLGYAHYQLGKVLIELDNVKAFGHLEKAEDHYKKISEKRAESGDEEDSEDKLYMAKLNFAQARAYEKGYLRDYQKPVPNDDVLKIIEEKLQTAMDITEESSNNDHQKWRAITMHEYALFLSRKEPVDKNKVEKLLRESLKMKSELWASDHVSVAIGKTDLARFYLFNFKKDTSEYKEVEDLLEEALKMKERVLPHYEQFLSWQMGVYYLIRLYQIVDSEEKRKMYEDILKTNSDKPFDEFHESSRVGGLPPDPLIWT